MSRFRFAWAFALAALLAPAIASAQFKQGDWELTLAGSASHGPDLDGVGGGVDVGVGYFFTNALEGAIRQNLAYSDIGSVTSASGNTSGGGDGSNWAGTTTVAVDWHFDLGRFQPFVGANIGYTYGDVHNTWSAGPEAGLKWFVNDTTFIFGRVQYEFNFDEGDDSDALSDGVFQYFLGIGFRF